MKQPLSILVPAMDADVAISVVKRRTRHGETWIRDFGGHRFESTMTLLSDAQGEGLVRERLGCWILN
jgi:hypothetical protein